MQKETLIQILELNLIKYHGDRAPIEVNEEEWTLADLFARQLLNNGGDGFDMVNVRQMYEMLCQNKQLLLDNNMISKVGRNNSGYSLWEDYNFDWFNNQEE